MHCFVVFQSDVVFEIIHHGVESLLRVQNQIQETHANKFISGKKKHI